MPGMVSKTSAVFRGACSANSCLETSVMATEESSSVRFEVEPVTTTVFRVVEVGAAPATVATLGV